MPSLPARRRALGKDGERVLRKALAVADSPEAHHALGLLLVRQRRDEAVAVEHGPQRVTHQRVGVARDPEEPGAAAPGPFSVTWLARSII